nr:SDR family oxidoreductase [Halalkalibacillus halophilus]
MRHVLITAGTKGLGLQMTAYFLKNGYSVTATYNNDRERAMEVKEQFSNYKDHLYIAQLNTMNVEEINQLVDHVYERFGRIDCLINNAGPFIFERIKLVNYEESQWDEMVRGNLDAAFHFARKVIPIMQKQQFGRMVYIGFQGVNHSSGWIYRSAFAAAKVGVASLMKTIAIEEAENKITANMVSPGKITGDMKESTIEESRKQQDSETPVGRPGSGEDIARTVGYLCHDDSDMITGSVIEVTGGLDVIHRHL